MSSPRVLAFSSSRVGSSGYLEMASPIINNFLGNKPLRVAFIPFADADEAYDQYVDKTRQALAMLPHTIDVAKPETARTIIEQADVMMTGGGNTFKLLHDLYKLQLVDLIRDKVNNGTPYIGWSAGSNITGLTIGTTNDMPIIEPESFKAFGFFPFQINPHYINVKPEGHNGETRDERLIEYLKVNQKAKIVGLPEGTALHLEGKILKLVGSVDATLFTLDPTSKKSIKSVIGAGAGLSKLLLNSSIL